jgi:hypothetical protein
LLKIRARKTIWDFPTVGRSSLARARGIFDEWAMKLKFFKNIR